MNKFVSRVSVALALAAAGAAQAAVDTAEITATKADVLLVGAAVLGVAISIKLYQWIRAALK